MSFSSDNADKFAKLSEDICALIEEIDHSYDWEEGRLNTLPYVHVVAQMQSHSSSLMIRYLDSLNINIPKTGEPCESPMAMMNAITDCVLSWLIMSASVDPMGNFLNTNPFDFHIGKEWYWGEEFTSGNIANIFFPINWTEDVEDFKDLVSFGVAYAMTHVFGEGNRDKESLRQHIFDMVCLKAHVKRSWIAYQSE